MSEQAPERTRRLRVEHVFVQPTLLWDDGVELTPAEPIQPKTLRPSEVAAYIESLPVLLAEAEARAADQSGDSA